MRTHLLGVIKSNYSRNNLGPQSIYSTNNGLNMTKVKNQPSIDTVTMTDRSHSDSKSHNLL